jgi:type I restriction enzyme M protein
MAYEKKKSKANNGNGNGIVDLTRELWQAAVTLRGSIEPADYKRYVLPIIFLRFLSLRYEKRRSELETMIAEPQSEYYRDKKAHRTAKMSKPPCGRQSKEYCGDEA